MSEDTILAAIQGIQTGIQRLEAGLEHLETRFGQLESHFGQIETRFEQLESRLEKLESRMDRLETRMDRLETQATDFRVVVMERFERVENRLTSMAEDISVNMAAAGYVNRKQEHDREDVRLLREIVFKMSMQISRLETGVEEVRKRPH